MTAKWFWSLGALVFVIAAAAWWVLAHRPLPHQLVRQPAPAVWLAQQYTNARGEVLNYRLLPPPGYQPGGSARYPLVITLHGDGCDGTDNEKQLICISPVLQTPEFRRQFSCFTLSPQCPPKTHWVPRSSYAGLIFHQTKQPSMPTRLLLALLPQILRDWPIDASRIYVMGYSSGCTGAYDLITRRPDLFAAAALISGRYDPSVAAKVKAMPIWMYHGRKDTAENVNGARLIVKALHAAGNQPLYHEDPTGDHEAGWKGLNDPGLFTWMFAQQRK